MNEPIITINNYLHYGKVKNFHHKQHVVVEYFYIRKKCCKRALENFDYFYAHRIRN